MRTTFYLARHGQSHWNVEQRFQGQLNSTLTSLGIKHSRIIAETLQDKPLDMIVSSTLGRARQTAHICQQILQLPLHFNQAFIERCLGDWQGQKVTSLQQHPDYLECLQQYSDLRPTKGESAINCAERFHLGLISLAKQHPSAHILIISHGEALRCLLAKLGQQANKNAYQLFGNGCTVLLSYDHQQQALQYLEQLDTMPTKQT